MYNRIMVPTDGSGFDRDAIRVALRVADRSGADVRLVRVVSSIRLLGLGEPFEPTALSMEGRHAEMSSARCELEALAAECRVVSDAKVTTELLDGPTTEMLEGYTQRNGVDLIVISSHGRGGMSRLTLGSVTDSLIRHTQIPVLVVKAAPSYLNPRAPAEIKRIVVPLDGSTLAEQILPSVASLAVLEGASLTLLHVLVLSGEGKGASRGSDIEVARAYLTRITDSLRWRNLSINTKIVVGVDVAQTIADYARRQKADLIAIATHGRGGLARMVRGSVADELTRSATPSMLVLRPRQVIHERPGQQQRARVLETAGVVA